jgi:tripartite-type tricarboxylate transporter receptor subunit TctC
MFVSNVSALPHVKSGKLRALAVTGRTRAEVAPDIPTVAESGVPGYEVHGWYGIAAPARTPRAVIDRLQGEVTKIAREPKMKARLAGQGLELIGNTPEAFDAFIRAELAKWAEVLQRAGLQAKSSAK